MQRRSREHAHLYTAAYTQPPISNYLHPANYSQTPIPTHLHPATYTQPLEPTSCTQPPVPNHLYPTTYTQPTVPSQPNRGDVHYADTCRRDVVPPQSLPTQEKYTLTRHVQQECVSSCMPMVCMLCKAPGANALASSIIFITLLAVKSFSDTRSRIVPWNLESGSRSSLSACARFRPNMSQVLANARNKARQEMS